MSMMMMRMMMMRMMMIPCYDDDGDDVVCVN